MMQKSQINARPHPCPLPRERENRPQITGATNIPCKQARLEAKGIETVIAQWTNELSNNAAWLTLSPGERAGVRASVDFISISCA